jgi:phage terminase small subunit
MPILTARQEQFANAVAQGKTHHEAAIISGYSPRSACCIGAQLARQERVAQRIRELREDRERALRTRETILAQLNLERTDLKPITISDSSGKLLGFFTPFAALAVVEA